MKMEEILGEVLSSLDSYIEAKLDFQNRVENIEYESSFFLKDKLLQVEKRKEELSLNLNKYIDARITQGLNQ